MNTSRLRNVLIAAVGALLFANFVVLAEGLDRTKNLTTTAAPVTTTTAVLSPTTTVASTTTEVTTPTTVTTATTVTHTTATTARTTATTGRTSSTTARTTRTTTSQRGVVTETSDNTASFVHNPDGSTSDSATPVPANDPLTFELSTSVQSASNETASVRFAARISNQSGRPITFPGGLKISLTVTPSSGAKFVVQLDAPSVTGLASGEQVTASSVQDVSGYGRFDVVGSCEVDYGS